jgi:hypothetical protein
MAWEKEPDVEFPDVTAIAQTDKALLCEIDGVQHWIPQSQISDDSEVYKKGDEGKLVITHWIAKEKGLI